MALFCCHRRLNWRRAHWPRQMDDLVHWQAARLMSIRFDFCDAARKLFGAELKGNGLAEFFGAGKIPEIWKILALLRLDRLNRTIIAIQEHTFAI